MNDLPGEHLLPSQSLESNGHFQNSFVLAINLRTAETERPNAQ